MATASSIGAYEWVSRLLLTPLVVPARIPSWRAREMYFTTLNLFDL